MIDSDKYVRKSKYPYTQIALLPTLLYQTRMKPKLCRANSYADLYNIQQPNPALPMFGLNAPREVHVPHETDGLIWCGDATTTETTDHDEMIATDMYNFFEDKVRVFYSAGF